MPDLRRSLKLLFQLAPGPVWVCGSVLLLEAGLGLAALYCLKLLVDALTATAAGTVDTAHGIQSMLWLAALSALLHALARAWSAHESESSSQLISDRLDNLLNAHAVRLDLACYESPQYYDVLTRALVGGTRPSRLIVQTAQLIQNGLMLLALAGMLVAVNPWLLPLLAAVLLPGLLVKFHFSRVQYRWNRGRTGLERFIIYLRWIITDKSYTKEVRSFGLGPHFVEQYAHARSIWRTEMRQLSLRRNLTEGLLGACVVGAFFGALAFLIHSAENLEAGLGGVLLFLVLFQRGQGVLESLRSNVAGLYENRLFLRNLFEFIDLRPSIVEKSSAEALPWPAGQSVAMDYALHDVTFSYPNAARPALSGVNLIIPAGQIVALVGANGSGKTTLIKLLCRLYDPDSGVLTLAGEDIRRYSLGDYRRSVSAIFQDYVHYYFKAVENIRFGDIRKSESDPRIQESARFSGADAVIRELPRGYDTVLGNVLDEGAELSLGQWQKIALARALMAQAPLTVLDEPSSALDPGAEFELFQNFRNVIGGRSALLISHRLSTVRQADYIYVLDAGRIVEEGTHDELIRKQGHYCDLFEKQAHHYR